MFEETEGKGRRASGAGRKGRQAQGQGGDSCVLTDKRFFAFWRRLK